MNVWPTHEANSGLLAPNELQGFLETLPRDAAGLSRLTPEQRNSLEEVLSEFEVVAAPLDNEELQNLVEQARVKIATGQAEHELKNMPFLDRSVYAGG